MHQFTNTAETTVSPPQQTAPANPQTTDLQSSNQMKQEATSCTVGFATDNSKSDSATISIKLPPSLLQNQKQLSTVINTISKALAPQQNSDSNSDPKAEATDDQSTKTFSPNQQSDNSTNATGFKIAASHQQQKQQSSQQQQPTQEFKPLIHSTPQKQLEVQQVQKVQLEVQQQVQVQQQMEVQQQQHQVQQQIELQQQQSQQQQQQQQTPAKQQAFQQQQQTYGSSVNSAASQSWSPQGNTGSNRAGGLIQESTWISSATDVENGFEKKRKRSADQAGVVQDTNEQQQQQQSWTNQAAQNQVAWVTAIPAAVSTSTQNTWTTEGTVQSEAKIEPTVTSAWTYVATSSTDSTVPFANTTAPNENSSDSGNCTKWENINPKPLDQWPNDTTNTWQNSLAEQQQQQPRVTNEVTLPQFVTTKTETAASAFGSDQNQARISLQLDALLKQSCVSKTILN